MRWFIPLLLFINACTFTQPSLTKKVILDVNGHQMTARDFSEELAFRLKDQDALSAKDPKLLKSIKDKIAEEFIVQSLSEDWAKANGVVVKADLLESQIQAVQKSYPDDLAFQQALTDQGISFKDWKARLQGSLLQKEVAKKVCASLKAPTDEEIQSFYQENKPRFNAPEQAQIRQILVATESDAKSIEDALKRGKKMADLAKKYSISPEADQAGLVGWVEKGLTDVFEPAFRMKQGQRSPIVKTSFGYHIFEVLGRKPSRLKGPAEVKSEIKSILMEKGEQALYLSWLEEQVRKSRIFKDQEFIDALKVETKSE